MRDTDSPSKSRCLDICAILAHNFNSISHMQPNARVGSISTAYITSIRSIYDYELQIFVSIRVRLLLLWASEGRVGCT